MIIIGSEYETVARGYDIEVKVGNGFILLDGGTISNFKIVTVTAGNSGLTFSGEVVTASNQFTGNNIDIFKYHKN